MPGAYMVWQIYDDCGIRVGPHASARDLYVVVRWGKSFTITGLVNLDLGVVGG